MGVFGGIWVVNYEQGTVAKNVTLLTTNELISALRADTRADINSTRGIRPLIIPVLLALANNTVTNY